MVGGEFNVNYLELTPTSVNPTPTPTPTPTPGPTPPPTTGRQTYGGNGSAWPIGSSTVRIQAENYDQGGEAVALPRQRTSATTAASTASDGVDIESTSGGGYDLGWVTRASGWSTP